MISLSPDSAPTLGFGPDLDQKLSMFVSSAIAMVLSKLDQQSCLVKLVYVSWKKSPQKLYLV